MLDQAIREHSGAGILNPGRPAQFLVMYRIMQLCSTGFSPDSRGTRMTPLDVESGGPVFCRGRFLNAGGTAEHDQLHVQNTARQFLTECDVPSRSM